MKKPTKNQLENVMLLGSINSILQRDREFYEIVVSILTEEDKLAIRTYIDKVGFTEEVASSITDEEYATIYASMIKQIVGIE